MIRPAEANWTAGAINFLWMLIRWKRFLFWNTFLLTSLAIAGAYTAKEIFEAKLILMPPSNEQGGGLSDFMRDFPLTKMIMGPSSAFAGSGSKNLDELYLAILGSRTLHMDVIEAFKLRDVYVYGDDYRKPRKPVYVRNEDLLKAFRKNLKVELTEEATVIILFKDSSPIRAAAIANYMAKRLDSRCKSLAVQAQRYQREFMAERLIIVRRDLQSAEDSLVAFQKRHRMVNMEEQGRASIEEGAVLEARFLAAELDLEMNRRIFRSDNPKIREKELELGGFQIQREKMANQRQSDLLIPYAMAPDLGMEYLRLFRNFKVQEALFEFLIPQFEQAKIEEARNTPNLQILDVAVPPQEKIFPPKRKMIQFTFFASIFLGAAMTFLLENFRKFRESNPAEVADLRRFWKTVFSWKFLRA